MWIRPSAATYFLEKYKLVWLRYLKPSQTRPSTHWSIYRFCESLEAPGIALKMWVGWIAALEIHCILVPSRTPMKTKASQCCIFYLESRVDWNQIVIFIFIWSCYLNWVIEKLYIWNKMLVLNVVLFMCIRAEFSALTAKYAKKIFR